MSEGYDPDHLLVAGGDGLDQAMRGLRRAASALGWDVALRNLDGSDLDVATALSRAARGRERYDLPTVYRAQIASRSDSGTRHPIDARRLRDATLDDPDVTGVSLDYILTLDRSPGSGVRQVAAWAGPPPRRTVTVRRGGRRPVVAVLDTGCGVHPWLDDDVVTRSPAVDGAVIGLTDPDTDPDTVGDVTGVLDGEIDAVSGHGTFIAGIVRQVCPDADIVTARVTDSDGTVREGAFFYAVRTLVKGMLLPADEGGVTIDVLNLSLSSYDAHPSDLLDRALVELLRRARECGCAVVCSAGNEGIDRPTFPAAAWEQSDSATRAPHVAVGAADRHGEVASFSNHGPWVHVYVPGVDVHSAYPPLDGGAQAVIALPHPVRETMDVDDFRGGFAIWSGTSFAAPFAAAMLARVLVTPLATRGDGVPVSRRIRLLREAERRLVARYGRSDAAS